MRIKKLAFWDNLREWRFEPIYFSNLALLVGVSGVGKTQILKSILSLQQIANGTSLNGLGWDITFATLNNIEYRWQGEFETKENLTFILNDDGETNEFRIVSENLFRDGNAVIQRTPNEIILKGKTTPKLSPFQSVVEILKQEEDISPVQQCFDRIIYSDNSTSFNEIYRMPLRVTSRYFNKDLGLETVQRSGMSIMLKLALIARHYPSVFNRIKFQFRALFPHVEDLKIEELEDRNNSSCCYLPIQMKEKNVNNWIFQDNISSGMLKTLVYISELYLLPEGRVILIDEVEYSLGINCMDVVTLWMVENSNIQFIFTSHHPYIINNIGMEYWKIVTRKGGVVTAIDAKDLNLGQSRHQAFMQLINLEEYSEGIKV